MGFWAVFGAFLVSTAINLLLAKKQRYDAPKASSLGDFSSPTAVEGRRLTLVYGTCKLQSPNCMWYGNLKVDAITERVRVSLFKKQTVTKGYRYSLGLHLGLCLGAIDKITQVIVGDKTAWSGTITPDSNGRASIYINQPTLFGGDDSEGGLQGTAVFYFGTSNQCVDEYLTGVGLDVPAFRGIGHMVWRRGYLSTSNYIKEWNFVVTRLPKALGSGYYNINDDANPIEIIYELLTDNFYGLGMSANMIDIDNFKETAKTLYYEGLGLSMQFDSQTTAKDIIDEICRHIDAMCFCDPGTGKVKIVLIRGGYDINSLLELNVSNVISIDKKRESWAGTINEVQVTYVDRNSGFVSKVVQAQDLANMSIQGGEICLDSVDYSGFSHANNALIAASRDLRMQSYPLDSLSIVATRIGYKVFPGSLFRLTWAPLGIKDKVFRVTRVSYGTLTDGRVNIEAMEDFYALGSATFTAPPASDWVPPVNNKLTKITHQIIFEAPYVWSGEKRYLVAIAGRPNGLYSGFQVWTMINNNYTLTNNNCFSPVGILDEDLEELEVSMTLRDISDVENLSSVSDNDFISGMSLALIDSELIAWKTISKKSDGSGYIVSEIYRGVLDTVPSKHNTGSYIYFLSEMISATQEEFTKDQSVKVKLLPVNIDGRALDINSADSLSVSLNSRAWRPYPPGNLQLNGDKSIKDIYADDVVISWSHRSRTQSPAIVAQSAGNTVSAPEGSYTIRVLIGG
ncbi:MAG: phage tail protein, partial [bacterium]